MSRPQPGHSLHVIISDDGCVSKKEYEDFSATPPHIADRIYDHFDPTGTNCWTVQTIASQFTIMDEDCRSTL